MYLYVLYSGADRHIRRASWGKKKKRNQNLDQVWVFLEVAFEKKVRDGEERQEGKAETSKK